MSEFGEKVGVCKVCEINLWSAHNNGPAIFPCGVLSCPYESKREREAIAYYSPHGSSLAQLIEESD